MNTTSLKYILKQIIGVLVFILVLTINFDLEESAHKFLAIFSFVVAQWLFSSIPLFISGIFGVCSSILLGVATPSEAFGPFAHPIIFLFMGGFLLARAMEKIGLDKALSLFILSSRLLRGKFKPTYASMMFINATFSMWISITATMAMMLPITMGFIKTFDIKSTAAKGTILSPIQQQLGPWNANWISSEYNRLRYA